MEDKKHITPFQTGVMAAMTVIGTALASLDPSKRHLIVDTAQKLIDSLPADKSLEDGSSEHHLALRALISGLTVADSKKPDA